MFKILRITWPDKIVNPGLLYPKVEELSEVEDFSEAVTLGKTFCELIDMAPTVIIKELSTGELTRVHPWDGPHHNVRGQHGMPVLDALRAEGKI